MMQTTTDMMAAWRQTGGVPSTAGRRIGATCIDVDASVSAAAVTYRMPGCAAENYIDADASVSAAAVTFRVPGCVAEECIDVDASVSAAAISWHGGVCRPAGAA